MSSFEQLFSPHTDILAQPNATTSLYDPEQPSDKVTDACDEQKKTNLDQTMNLLDSLEQSILQLKQHQQIPQQHHYQYQSQPYYSPPPTSYFPYAPHHYPPAPSYSHHYPPPPPYSYSPFNPSILSLDNAIPRVDFPDKLSRNICHHYMIHGSCNNDSVDSRSFTTAKCNKYHVRVPSRICFDFLKSNRCDHAQTCRYKHMNQQELYEDVLNKFVMKHKNEKKQHQVSSNIFEMYLRRYPLLNSNVKCKPHVVFKRLGQSTSSAPFSSISSVPLSTSYSPAQIRKAYGLSQITETGKGQVIVIVDAFLYSGNLLSDFKTFDAQYNLGHPEALTVDTSLATQADPDWSIEIALDVQAAHLIAPEAQIVQVSAKSDNPMDLLDAIRYAVAKYNPCALPMSFGSTEFPTQLAYDSYFASPTTVFLASAGDSTGPNWPSTSSKVLSIGGTTLVLQADGMRVSESAWSSGGGGISQYVSAPAFQVNNLKLSAGAKRQTPDVSMIADPDSGGLGIFAFYQGQSQWLQVGGTSLSTPLWSGLVALMAQKRAQNNQVALSTVALQTYLYGNCLPSDRQFFNVYDVIAGRSGSNVSRLGYDLVTGIGTPQCAPLSVSETIPLVILTGSGAPLSSLGSTGQYYVDLSSGNCYLKNATTLSWSLLSNFVQNNESVISVQGLVIDGAQFS